jgi:hypothetical protein
MILKKNKNRPKFLKRNKILDLECLERSTMIVGEKVLKYITERFSQGRNYFINIAFSLTNKNLKSRQLFKI